MQLPIVWIAHYFLMVVAFLFFLCFNHKGETAIEVATVNYRSNEHQDNNSKYKVNHSLFI